MSPWIQHVVARDALTFTQDVLGERAAKNTDLQEICSVSRSNNLRPNTLPTLASRCRKASQLFWRYQWKLMVASLDWRITRSATALPAPAARGPIAISR
jgi:hypothetical protein